MLVQRFTDILGNADRWKLLEYTKGLEDVSKWDSDTSSALIASLMASDAYRPDEMLRYQVDVHNGPLSAIPSVLVSLLHRGR